MENKNTFFEQLKEKLNKVNEELKTNNILLILAVYVIGTVIVIIHNLNEGIPFSTYSIITYAILTVYFAIFAGASLFSKYWLELIAQNEYKGNCFIKFIKKLLSMLIVMILIIIIMFLIMNQILYNTNIGEICAYAIILYCLWPLLGCSKKYNKLKEFSVILIVVTTLNLIFNIPASVGGLKPTQVTFYSYNNNIVYEYLYYGDSNGNFIFKENENKNKITLRSHDSGYIEYYRKVNVEEETVKYKIEIKEILSKIVEIEAIDKNEALRKIEEQYRNGVIVLDSGDYIDTEIKIYND